MTTDSGEYNKIHALAYARKVLFDKYGSNLLHFWRLADDTPFIWDLLRQKVLVGTSGVSPQAAGMLDYGVDIKTGYITDDVEDQGSYVYGQGYDAGSVQYGAIVMALGLWQKVRFRSSTTTPVTVYVGVPDIPVGNLGADALFAVTTSYLGSNVHEAVFPFQVAADVDQYWVYFPNCNVSVEGNVGWDFTQKQWVSPSWVNWGSSTQRFMVML